MAYKTEYCLVFMQLEENYKTLVSQMDVLNPEKSEHENPRFEDEIKSLCNSLHLNIKELILRTYNEFKASGRRSISDQLNKLLVTVDTLSTSNVDCEREFNAINNIIITDCRNVIKTSNARKQLFISTVGPPCEKRESRAIRKNLAWKRKKSRSLNKWHACQNLKKNNYYEALLKVFR